MVNAELHAIAGPHALKSLLEEYRRKAVEDGPTCHPDDACRRYYQDRIARARREVLERPAVFVGTGTCGAGAGADKTLEAVRAYATDRNLGADIVEVGCLGLCTAEPIVDVQVPGRARVSFRSVTA